MTGRKRSISGTSGRSACSDLCIGQLDDAVAEGRGGLQGEWEVQTFRGEQAFPGADHDRVQQQPQLVDQAFGQQPSDGGTAAAGAELPKRVVPRTIDLASGRGYRG